MTGTVTLTVFIAIAGVLYGLDKSLAPGAGMLAVALLAGVMPAKQATGITLIMAIFADWSAIWAYRHNVAVKTLLRLLPSVFVGVLLGAGFLFLADNRQTKLTIGVILAIFVSFYFLSKLRDALKARRSAARGQASSNATDGGRADDAADRGVAVNGGENRARAGAGVDESTAEQGKAPGTPRGAQPQTQGVGRVWQALRHVFYGVLAGFTTMVANVGGPVTSIYFMSEHLPVLDFLGTTAWFYLIINLVKLPFSIALKMVTWANVVSILWTIPVIIVSVLCGRWLAKRLKQSIFTAIVYVFAVAAVIQLFL